MSAALLLYMVVFQVFQASACNFTKSNIPTWVFFKASHLMSKVFKLVKLLLAMAATNPTCERLFIKMKHTYKTFLRNTRTGN